MDNENEEVSADVSIVSQAMAWAHDPEATVPTEAPSSGTNAGNGSVSFNGLPDHAHAKAL